MRGVVPAWLCGSAILLAACGLAACVTEGPPPRAKPRDVPEPPGLQPDVLVLSAAQFTEDVDGNGFVDTLLVTVYLFPPRHEHAVPIHEPGTLVFNLRPTERDGREANRTIAQWVLPPSEIAKGRVEPNGLPGYEFRLNLNDVANDRMALTRANLRCTWIGLDGREVEVRGPTTVKIGPLNPSAAREALRTE